jgi:ATP-dependent DNA helicase PIF1
VLLNLLEELDIVLLQPPGHLTDNTWYRRQFRTDFWVCRGHVLTWLYFLKANHPDYRHITISIDRITALPVDDDVSSSVVCITDDTLSLDGPEGPTDTPPNTQSAVLSLDQDTTEANLILEGITGHRPPSGLPAPSIRHTPIDEASRRERILSLAFPTLYPTGQADLNTP